MKAAVLIIGPPNVIVSSDDIWAAFLVTEVACELTVAASSVTTASLDSSSLVARTVPWSSVRIGTDSWPMSRTASRISSSTRPSFSSGTAMKATSATNATAAIRPAISPTDISLPRIGPHRPYPVGCPSAQPFWALPSSSSMRRIRVASATSAPLSPAR